MITFIVTFLGGTVAGYVGYRVGFKMGVLAAMARMNAVIVQMQDVVADINDFQKQWTEDDL
jgi:threonine synthase